MNRTCFKTHVTVCNSNDRSDV